MYGVIFDFLRNYVVERHGGVDTWRSLLESSGLGGYKVYYSTRDYPDEEIGALAQAAAKTLDMPVDDVLEDFGAFVGPQLLAFYHMYLPDPTWRTFDVVEHAGNSIHDEIHQHNPLRKPPQLKAERLSDDEMIVTYFSERKLCPVVRGIIRGLGELYRERFDISETACMYHGAPECVFRVKRIP